MKSKICTKCKIRKSLIKFSPNSYHTDKRQSYCRKCSNIYKERWRRNNKKKINAIARKWRKNNREKVNIVRREWLIVYPWLRHFYSAKQRCNDSNCNHYKWYGGRGIRFLLTHKDMKFLWFRDKAYLMEKPSIDRINNDGNYIIENCRFIEYSENFRKDNTK